MQLYKLTDQFRQLHDLDGSEDIPADVIRDTLEGLEGDIKDKVHAVACMIENLGAEAEAIQDAANAMTARSKRVKARAESLKQYLLFSLQAVNMPKLKYNEFTVSVRDNPVSVKIGEDAVIPDEFMVTPEPPPPQPDKKAIKDALTSGREIPGAWLERGQRVEIRT